MFGKSINGEVPVGHESTDIYERSVLWVLLWNMYHYWVQL